MKFEDVKYKLNEFWFEFKQIKSGIVGVILLIILISLLIFEKIIIPFPEASTNWNNASYWEDNPRSVPPAWSNFFTKEKKAVSDILIPENLIINDMGRLKEFTATIEYDYDYKLPPIDLIFRFEGKGNLIFQIEVERPDGIKHLLITRRENFTEFQNVRISIHDRAKREVFGLANQIDYANASMVNPEHTRPTNIIFSKAEPNMIKNITPLNGTYKFHLKVTSPGTTGELSEPKMIVVGAVSGILGTDGQKRDLWSGIVAGVRWALIIGLLTSIISVFIGVTYGVVSAFYGGIVDTIMQRIFELFISVPVLPVIIVTSAIFQPSIWLLIGIMCLFFWAGPVRTVRSIGLQIKEETYIEASKALGAKNKRLIFKHMIPLLIPYSFASMALAVPGAIVYESTISVIGLGDSSIVTWGQILNSAYNSGAMIQGLWWWIVPPGLMIALVGMTFAFVGFAMDKILLPKLKTR
jgi:peptide/nickel transport system permease protein